MPRNLRAPVAGIFLAPALLLAACGQPTKFDSANFSDGQSITKSAGTYWKHAGWWSGMPRDVKKVAITQFSVEYATENVSKSGADTLSILGAAEMLGAGRRKRVFTEETKQQLPGPMYAAFVKALQEDGIEVVPMEDLTRHPAFAQMKTAANGGSSNQFGRDLLGHANRSESAKLEYYSAPGLPMVDDGWFNAGNNIKAEWMMAGDTGAQAALRVRMRVGLDDDGRATLGGGSTISVAYEPKKEQWSPNQPAEWVFKQRGAIASQGAFRDDVPVITAKEFKAFQGDVYTIDGPRYQESVLKMYPVYARMAVVLLRGS